MGFVRWAAFAPSSQGALLPCSVRALTSPATRLRTPASRADFDALTLAFAKPSPSPAGAFPPPNLEFDTTSFPISGPQADAVRAGALQLATALRAKHAYTDAANFT